eukprot:CAMPEP_0171133352 /NCGR_PEP_ID=MMETSP0766_2-20121228/126137_1 /TAXON_ID=439317 /ORGANISM="Gambierdiscus australes, Strain CAWD 149" /LENGTH=179 /DNA_ID=CAMNT_0011596727 /DNA_START=51 /DNA_END=590 /DNA_ORIENTATION=+
MWTTGARLRTVSNPAISPSQGHDGSIGELGEMHIRRRMNAAKERQRNGRQRLEDLVRQTRELGETSTISRFGNQWLGADRKSSKGVSFDTQPRYVGQQANELSKWMNAESITRYKEEKDLGVPTLRQVLKVDDDIAMRQMTKSQLAALPWDPLESKKGPREDPDAVKRYTSGYRPVVKT